MSNRQGGGYRGKSSNRNAGGEKRGGYRDNGGKRYGSQDRGRYNRNDRGDCNDARRDDRRDNRRFNDNRASNRNGRGGNGSGYNRGSYGDRSHNGEDRRNQDRRPNRDFDRNRSNDHNNGGRSYDHGDNRNRSFSHGDDRRRWNDHGRGGQNGNGGRKYDNDRGPRKYDGDRDARGGRGYSHGGDRDRGRGRDQRPFEKDERRQGRPSGPRKPRIQDRVASSISPEFTYAGPMGVDEYHAHRDELKAREGKRLAPTREEREREERRMREAGLLPEEPEVQASAAAGDVAAVAASDASDGAAPDGSDSGTADGAAEAVTEGEKASVAQGASAEGASSSGEDGSDAVDGSDAPAETEGQPLVQQDAEAAQDSERYNGKRSKSELDPFEDLPRRVRSNPKVTPARIAAYLVGREVRERDAYVSAVIPKVFAAMGNTLTPIDAGFATKLARGVMSTQGTLDEVINRNIKHADDLRGEVRDAIRVSTYELMYLGKESYVVNDQGVELVRFFEPKAANLANAVLRRVSKDIRDFPYGNPEVDDRAFARAHAFPLWMARRLIAQMGREKAAAFMDASNTDATVYVGVNRAKATDQEVLDVFARAEAELEPQEDVPGCYLMKSGRALRNEEVRKLISGGKILISDKAAQTVALFALPEEEPARMLEVGAGRGTKTILIESNAIRAYGHTIPMTSVDNLEFKKQVLEKRLEAYGIDNVTPLMADGRHLTEELEPESFDAVFIDAPCSGTGTMRRHPEIRWRLRPQAVEQLSGLEQAILSECSAMVAPGGQLVYATCSAFIEENERVVERFLKSMRGAAFKPEAMMTTTLEAGGPDAHFAIRLRRVK